ncbi:P-loop containing nucleoside triphosphate hydrolase protein [Crepidotus variabilis]|uniref:P-loop containing nucleoside triphosphate hydrolase protein n=1 Tax=Crepidotus variabilis TaxID=179855 RepID=A0A9P6E5I4_9AGAR|nr:P-loop containing nucleoside triphosphate hydrolase protein [Crepidotus variabilis]
MPHNVLLFGETGSGKSSVVNMLAGREVARTSSGAAGCTFRSEPFGINIGGTNFVVHDTAGLDEGDQGRVPKSTAIVQLYSLMKRLDDGVSLLIFVMKAPRIKDSYAKNWALFNDVICRSKVPISIVVTGLEQEDDMDSWWNSNQDHFRRNGMYPVARACITAIKGKLRRSGTYVLQEEYDESRDKVQKLIKSSYLEHPWKMELIQWYSEVIYATTVTTGWCGRTSEKKDYVRTIEGAVDTMKSKCGMSEEEANKLAGMLEKV